MQKRHRPLPRIWLMTDERLGDDLLPLIRALPRGTGIVFRHYATPPKSRRALFDAVRRVTRRAGHMLLLAGTAQQARGWRADGVHGRVRGALTAPVHDLREMRTAEHSGAQLLFVSPVFPTRSHPGARHLGRVRFLALANQARRPVIALGGMTADRFEPLKKTGIYGWAAIDGLSRHRA